MDVGFLVFLLVHMRFLIFYWDTSSLVLTRPSLGTLDELRKQSAKKLFALTETCWKFS